MANYVTNVITFTEELSEKQLLFLQEIKRLGVCEFLRPIPTEMYEAENSGRVGEEQKSKFIEKYGVSSSYDWAVQKWGTKSGDFQTEVDEGNITFESAWTQLSDEILDMFSVIFPTIYELLQPYKNNEIGFYEDTIDEAYLIGKTREEVEKYVFEKHNGKASVVWTEN